MSKGLRHTNLQIDGGECVEVGGTFAPAGAGAPTLASGEGWSVARTDVGKFLVTFKDVYAGIKTKWVDVQLNALANTDVMFGPYVAASKTIEILVKTAGVAADIAANANNQISFGVTFKKRKVTN